MRSAEVVVIGAGVVGASVAYHLAERGCGPVVVLEREAGPGRGSTGRASGGFRGQFASETNVRLSLLAREKLLRFEEELGVDPGYRQCGYLFLADDEARLEALRETQSVQRAAGLDEAREVRPEEIAELNPAVPVEGLVGGVYCPTDGFIRPPQILRGYLEGAEQLGVRFEYGVRVRDSSSTGRAQSPAYVPPAERSPRALSSTRRGLGPAWWGGTRGSRSPWSPCAGRWPLRTRSTPCPRTCR